jgi:hypothetical protein
LSGSEICERIGNLIRIIDFVDVVFIMTRSLLHVGFGDLNSNGSITKQIAKFGFVVEVLATRMEGGLATKPIGFH